MPEDQLITSLLANVLESATRIGYLPQRQLLLYYFPFFGILLGWILKGFPWSLPCVLLKTCKYGRRSQVGGLILRTQGEWSKISRNVWDPASRCGEPPVYQAVTVTQQNTTFPWCSVPPTEWSGGLVLGWVSIATPPSEVDQGSEPSPALGPVLPWRPGPIPGPVSVCVFVLIKCILH